MPVGVAAATVFVPTQEKDGKTSEPWASVAVVVVVVARYWAVDRDCEVVAQNPSTDSRKKGGQVQQDEVEAEVEGPYASGQRWRLEAGAWARMIVRHST